VQLFLRLAVLSLSRMTATTMKKFTLTTIAILSIEFLYSQCGTPGIVCMSNGNVVVSDGFNFYDDGFTTGSYSDANYTLTLCPDTPGDVVQLTFSALALQTSPNPNNSDYLEIFDGNSTAAPSLGFATQGLSWTGTVNNTSGCLTLVFQDNGPGNTASPGWEAAIECTTPCDNPVAHSEILTPSPSDPAIQTVNVCLGQTVTFGDNGSFPQPGYALEKYIWNMDDGTIIENTNASNVTYAFTAPGEYIVTLTVEDGNLGDDATGCQSLNIEPLQVLVSTAPTYSGMVDLQTCLGDTVYGIVIIGENALLEDNTNIGGSASGTTWTALPPQVVSGETYLADGAGFSYSTSLNFDFFEAGSTLTSCDDLDSIFVNMEHSYMGDLGLFITCPDGTTVDLVEWGVNGGGTTFLGDAIDTDAPVPGVGWNYAWTPTATNGTWGENSASNTVPTTEGEALAPGIYESQDDLCGLVGCPLNGQWSFSVTDNIGLDNGYIFSWGIGFNPELYPDVTTFTPTIGAGPDSSYWVMTGPDNGIPWITSISSDGDVIEIIPGSTGVFDFTYYVINSFGCSFDTTIQVTCDQAPLVTAGTDQLLSCLPAILEGGLQGDPAVACADCGVFSYCYTTFDNTIQTYCPDNAADGPISISITSGSIDVNDNLFVYDGAGTWPSPQIGAYTGDLNGLVWTSSDASGCLTMQFSEWNGIGNCADGVSEELVYNVIVGSAEVAGYVWNWTPGNPLTAANSPAPSIVALNQPSTTFTLTGYPAGYPGCRSSDSVVITLDQNNNPGLGDTITICPTLAPFDLFDVITANPATWGQWFLNNTLVSATNELIFDPMNDTPDEFEYRLDGGAGCSNSSFVGIEMPLPTTMTISDDTTLCFAGTANLDLYTINPGLPPFIYSWEFENNPISNAEDFSFNPDASGEACLTITDACAYSITECLQIEVLPIISPAFTADTTAGCWPNAFELNVSNDPSEYATSRWELSNGIVIPNQPETILSFEEPGTYGVELVLVNSAGCEYSISEEAFLTSYPAPIAGYTVGPQPTDIFNTELQFESVVSGFPISNYLWTFSSADGTLLGGSAAANPIFTFPNDYGGIYYVTLEITDIHNCTDFISGNSVVINDLLQFYIPTGFTPNYDGLNDVLLFEGADIDTENFHFEIFNRFGELVFETRDPKVGWTGNIRGGEHFAPNGAYSWRAIIVSRSTGAKKDLSGSVLIMR